jgi:hypothetical protein
MGPQNRESPNFGNFETITWESRYKMTFGCWSCGHAHSILWGGWWLPPSAGRGESCEFEFARNSFVHQKCALTNLLFGLCKSVWIIKLPVNLLSPHLEVATCPFTPKVLRTKDVPWLFRTCKFTFEFIKELGNKSASIWFPTTKSRNHPNSLACRWTCHVSLERFQQMLQLFFKPHLN